MTRLVMRGGKLLTVGGKLTTCEEACCCKVELKTRYGFDISFDSNVLSPTSTTPDAATISQVCPGGVLPGCDLRICRRTYSNSAHGITPAWSRSTNLDFDLSLAFNNDPLIGSCDPDYTSVSINRPAGTGCGVGALVRSWLYEDGWRRKTRDWSGFVRSCIVETISNPQVIIEVARQRDPANPSNYIATHIRVGTSYNYSMTVRSRFIGTVSDGVERQDFNWFNLFTPQATCTIPGGGGTFLNRQAQRRAVNNSTPGNFDVTTVSWMTSFIRNPNGLTTTTTNTSHTNDACSDVTFPTFPNPTSDPAITTKANLAANYRTVGFTENISGFGNWQTIPVFGGSVLLAGAQSERPFLQAFNATELATAIAAAQTAGMTAYRICTFGGTIPDNGGLARVLTSGQYGAVNFPMSTVGDFGAREALQVELSNCAIGDFDCV